MLNVNVSLVAFFVVIMLEISAGKYNIPERKRIDEAENPNVQQPPVLGDEGKSVNPVYMASMKKGIVNPSEINANKVRLNPATISPQDTGNKSVDFQTLEKNLPDSGKFDEVVVLHPTKTLYDAPPEDAEWIIKNFARKYGLNLYLFVLIVVPLILVL